MVAARAPGCILAGGEGKRVGGEDKGLLPLQGRPLIEHVLDALRGQCDELLIVANRNPDDYAEYAQVIADERAGHAGPLAGISAALNHVSVSSSSRRKPGSSLLLTVPVDCPQPPHGLRRRLHDALMHTPAAGCAYAHDGQGAQPLFALYRLAQIEALLASARAALAEHASVRLWHAEIGASAVDFSDCAALFHNLNTPQDFRDYERRHG